MDYWNNSKKKILKLNNYKLNKIITIQYQKQIIFSYISIVKLLLNFNKIKFNNIIILLLLFSNLLLTNCSESKKDIITRLTNTISNPKQDSESLKKTQIEIENLLNKENYNRSKVINNNKQKYIIDFSMDGKTAAWYADSKLLIFQNDSKISLEPNINQVVVDFNLSYNGNFIILILKNGKSCNFKVISVKEKKISNSSSTDFSCNQSPAVDDKGEKIYYFDNGNLNYYSLEQSIQTQEDSLKLNTNLKPVKSLNNIKTLVSSKNFNFKYRNVSPKQIIYTYKPNSLLIFYGNAGVYDIYFYNILKNKLNKHKLTASTPELFLSSKYENLNKNDLELKSQKVTISTISKIKENLNFANLDQELEKIEAFIYTGNAGKYEIRPINITEDQFKIGNAIKSEIYNKIIYITHQAEFMVMQKQKILFWNPKNSIKQKIPFSIKNFYAFNGGILFIDTFNKIYHRKEKFTEFEQNLIDLYNDILNKE